MPDKYGATHVAIPREMMEEYVLPTQERVLKETGFRISHGLIVRRLLEKGFVAEIQQCQCHVSSGVQS